MHARKIGIIGCGYVGLVTGVCLASLGHELIMQDIDEKKIAQLCQSVAPFYERDLEELLAEHRERILFTTSLDDIIDRAEYIFICVGTPAMASGAADTSAFDQVMESVRERVTDEKIIIIKSTVPVGTASKVQEMLRQKPAPGKLHIVSNPEFLREGNAIYDFCHPDRIVIGAAEVSIRQRVAELYEGLTAPVLLLNNVEAEVVKYASNNFLAMKISFINEFANICEKVGADISKTAYGIGLDHRIGTYFLQAGLGFGGPCLVKDLQEMIYLSESELGYEPELLKAALHVNELQTEHLLTKLKSTLANLKEKRIGLLGLAFKAETDDMRSAPSLKVIDLLLREGARVTAYDPMAMENARILLGDRIDFAVTPYEVGEGASAVVILTEWKEFQDLNYARLKANMLAPILFDGRNLLSKLMIERLERMGYRYEGIGRAWHIKPEAWHTEPAGSGEGGSDQ